MLKKNDLIQTQVHSLAHGGEGIGKINGITVFIPDTVPGDKVNAKITSVKKAYAKALLTEIIEPSKIRVKPFCGLAKVCGGCQVQHIDYAEQLKLKKKIVEDNFNKIANLNVEVKDPIENPNNTGYRCKIQYPVQQTKVSKRFLLGYYKKGTHEIVNIKHCPIQPSIVDNITEFIRENSQKLGLNAYNEKQHSGLIRHFIFKVSKSNNNILLIVVINASEASEEFKNLCFAIKNRFKQVIGIMVNFNTSKTNAIMSDNTQRIWGKEYMVEKLNNLKFKVSANSFFQVNPEMAEKLFLTVKSLISSRINKPSILDIYSGVGTFSIFLKDIASRITAIEENPNAIKDAKENLKINVAPDDANIDIIEGNANTVLAELTEQGKKFDVTIIDPPRKGCSSEALDLITRLTDKFIIYVSCDPATLARDVKILNQNGFVPEFIQPVDMFSHTYHIESIVVLKRQ